MPNTMTVTFIFNFNICVLFTFSELPSIGLNLGAMSYSIMTFSITTLSKMVFCVECHLYWMSFVLSPLCWVSCHYAECHYAKCCCTECRGALNWTVQNVLFHCCNAQASGDNGQEHVTVTEVSIIYHWQTR